ncbi:hypothetical protein ACFXKF_25695 [Streptomyces scopuliridis]|uniref:hypothetical protein n=1 Tax=Streptomyces scopuliridis TaxID=452529 RepID=UPI0036825A52
MSGRGPCPGRPGEALAAALLGFFVVTLDALVVNVALPVIRTGLGDGMTGLQWVVGGYTLRFAALPLSAGSLSDRVGARRAFGIGPTVFVAASAARSPRRPVPFDVTGRISAVIAMGRARRRRLRRLHRRSGAFPARPPSPDRAPARPRPGPGPGPG